MTKYIKLTSLLLLIAVTLTGFGLYNAQAGSPYPELKIVTSDGKPENALPVHLFGFVSDSHTYSVSSVVEFKNGKSQYIKDKPLLERMDINYTPHINDLIENHRSFMRGKSRRAEHYTETEQHVFYTGLESDVHWGNPSLGNLTIAMLDKESEEEETYSVSLGNDGTYYEVRAVYADYPTLHLVIATNDSSDLPQTHIYSFDLENPSEELTEVVDLSRELESDAVYIGQSFDRTERFITIQTVRDTSTSDFDYSFEPSGYFAYDREEGELIEIPLFEEDTLLFTDKDTLYVGKDLGDAIELYEMSEEDQDLQLIGTIALTSPTIGDDEYGYYNGMFNQKMTIMDGIFFAYESQYTDNVSRPHFQITDVGTQETLFHGSIMPKDTTKMDNTNVDIFEFRLDPAQNN